MIIVSCGGKTSENVTGDIKKDAAKMVEIMNKSGEVNNEDSKIMKEITAYYKTEGKIEEFQKEFTNQFTASVTKNIGNDFNESSYKINELAKVDSIKIKELLPFFDVKKDEFDPKGAIWYIPKSAPKYANRNGIFCYFMVQNGKPGPLRFKIQYYADNWLFIRTVQFSIDNSAYEFTPMSTERDNDGGMIWEWFDEALSNADHDLIHALSKANSARMKLIGSQYFDIKTITKNQITDIKRALDLYLAMGGIF